MVTRREDQTSRPGALAPERPEAAATETDVEPKSVADQEERKRSADEIAHALRAQVSPITGE